MASQVVKVAYVGEIDPTIKKLFRYEYMGRNIVSFKPSISTLIGADFSYKIQDGLHYQIWEIDLTKRFESVRTSYYHGCTAGIVIFSLENLTKIKNLVTIVEEIWDNCGSGTIPIAFVGIRDIYSSLNNDAIEEYNKQIRSLIDKHNDSELNLAYFESSIQFGENSQEIFSFFNYLFNGTRFKEQQHLSQEKLKYHVIIIENNNEELFLNKSILKHNLIFTEQKHIYGKCVADLSRIELNEHTHTCQICKSTYCDTCFDFYCENTQLECPGSNTIFHVHSPTFLS